MKRRSKFFLIFGIIVVVLILVAINLMRSGDHTITVTTQPVDKTDVISLVSGSGKIQPKTSVNITSEVNAEVISIPVKEGWQVTRGQTLIQLDTLQLKKDMEAAQFSANELDARLDATKTALDQAEDEYQRQKRLFDKKLTSEQAYKDADYAFRSQTANYEAMVQQRNAAFSRLEKAQDNLAKTTIKSPMDGTVTLLDVEVGEIAQAQTSFTQGRTLMVISDISEFEVEVEIDETDVADLEVGQKASVEIDAFPDTVFAGKVIEIGNTATTSNLGTTDQETNFKVKVALSELDRKIRPGMSATVDITTNEHFGVLAVPIQALVMREVEPEEEEQANGEEEMSGSVAVASTTDDTLAEELDPQKKVEKEGVFVVRDGEAQFVAVETGIADQQNIEIANGLDSGDVVITGSYKTLRTLRDKTAVESKTEKPVGRNNR